LLLRKIDSKEIKKRVHGILEKVGLQNLEKRYPGQLSGGQQQRVALARALVLNPGLLLLDEPLSNLDAKIRVQVRAEIRKLQKEFGITAVYVTHDQEEALALSDRIAVFNQGKLQQLGPPRELYERPANRFVADFIGVNNVIEGTAREGSAVETPLGIFTGIKNETVRPAQRCVVCVRPENVSFGSAHENKIKGKVAYAAYLGNSVRYDVDAGNGIVIKAEVRDARKHVELAMGTEVTLGFPAASTLIVAAEG
jgi:ABC-type Fe3+/spermidine/putrescine transport system ATPase subunit